MPLRTRKRKTRKKSRAKKESEFTGLALALFFFLGFPLLIISLFVPVIHGMPLFDFIATWPIWPDWLPLFPLWFFCVWIFLPIILASIATRSRFGIYPIILMLPMFLFTLLFPYEASFEYADKVMLLNLPYVVKEALSWLVGPGIFIGLLLLTTWIGVKISVYLYRKFELEE
ncbi:MAG: hypothetical protein ACTSV7_13875, partial [Candidatus Baldrarchaeia archaeon]